MEREPGDPAERPAQPDASGELGHGRAPADDGHVPLVPVAEGLGRLPLHPGADRPHRVLGPLRGDGGELGQGPALAVGGEGDVADDEDLGVTGEGEVGFHPDPPARRQRAGARRAGALRGHRGPRAGGLVAIASAA